MEINQESVAAYKELLTNPKAHGLGFEPLTECFEKSETATAQHILYKQFLDYIKKPLPKVFFYIVMNDTYGLANGYDPNHKFGNGPNAKGCLGWFLKLKPELINKSHE
jgi:hypothetical protein